MGVYSSRQQSDSPINVQQHDRFDALLRVKCQGETIDEVIRYDTIEEINVDSKAEYTA